MYATPINSPMKIWMIPSLRSPFPLAAVYNGTTGEMLTTSYQKKCRNLGKRFRNFVSVTSGGLRAKMKFGPNPVILSDCNYHETGPQSYRDSLRETNYLHVVSSLDSEPFMPEQFIAKIFKSSPDVGFRETRIRKLFEGELGNLHLTSPNLRCSSTGPSSASGPECPRIEKHLSKTQTPPSSVCQSGDIADKYKSQIKPSGESKILEPYYEDAPSQDASCTKTQIQTSSVSEQLNPEVYAPFNEATIEATSQLCLIYEPVISKDTPFELPIIKELELEQETLVVPHQAENNDSHLIQPLVKSSLPQNKQAQTTLVPNFQIFTKTDGNIRIAYRTSPGPGGECDDYFIFSVGFIDSIGYCAPSLLTRTMRKNIEKLCRSQLIEGQLGKDTVAGYLNGYFTDSFGIGLKAGNADSDLDRGVNYTKVRKIKNSDTLIQERYHAKGFQVESLYGMVNDHIESRYICPGYVLPGYVMAYTDGFFEGGYIAGYVHGYTEFADWFFDNCIKG